MNEAVNSKSSGLFETAIGQKYQTYYAHKFFAFDQKGSGLIMSWNWGAFFFGGVWALYRKMYGWFFAWWFVALMVGVLSSIPNVQLQLVLAAVASVSWLGFAVFANSLYYSRIKAWIATANKANTDASLVSSRLRVMAGTHSWVPIVFGVTPAIGIAAAVVIPVLLGKSKEQVAVTHPEVTSTTFSTAGAELKLQTPGQPTSNYTDFAGIKKLAEQGHASAQNKLGEMYFTGQEVPTDEQLGLEWFRKAAEQGYAEAQFNMGLLYAGNQRLPTEGRSAYFWLLLASAQGHQNAANFRDAIGREMPSDQRAAAQAAARAWQPKPSALDTPAAPKDWLQMTPAPQKLGRIDSYRYDACQKEAAFAPTPQGVSIGLRICREKFGQ